MEYFARCAEKWSRKRVSKVQFLMYDKPYFECYLTFKDATDFIKKIVTNRKKKPFLIMSHKEEKIISQFIKGFSDSEGCFCYRSCSGRIGMYNKNKIVLEQIRGV